MQETIGYVYCPTFRNENCDYISTNKMTSFYDCKKCKACCHVLNILFNDQKPTIMLFGGDGTHYFARKTSRDYEKKPSQSLKKFLRQSDPRATEPEQKKIETYLLWHNRVGTPLIGTVNQKFIYIIILKTFSLP